VAKKRQNNWQQLLKQVEVDDGLEARDSGYWAEDKLVFWNRYVSITTTSMVGNPAWPAGVVYIDLFCGPGVRFERKSKRRFPGSPLIAANAPKPFTKILLCEKDSKNADACRKRMDISQARDRYELFEGDCNLKIRDVVARIPERSLALAFLDPTGLHAHFDTVKALANRGRTDLLILFPDAVDILRNEKRYFEQEASNLNLVLGAKSNWKARRAALDTSDASKIRQLYTEIYKDQLKTECGYEFFAHEVIKKGSVPLYRLVYATMNERGLDFWQKSVKEDSAGQSRLNFES
jgi:three-Cys-motif partner protein